MQHDNRVIVAGAGPVGAITALALVKKGIPVTLLEAEAEPPEDQRAATIHPPTVEMLVELGLKDAAFAEDASGGMSAPLFHFRDRVTGELVAVFDIGLLEGEVPYPFVVQWEQYKLVRAALPRIEASGLAEVRFSTKVTGLAQHADHVDVTVTNAGGETETMRGRYVIGTDGGRSTVRRLAGIEFEGFTWPERFIKIAHQLRFRRDRQGFCTRNYFSDPNEWLNLFKVKGYGRPGIWRGILPVPADETDEQALSLEGIQRRLQRHPSQERRLRHPLSRALCRASARGRDLQQGPRAARRRQRPCQQSDRRHGHERRHPRRHQSRRQARRRLVRPRRARRCSTATPASGARRRSITCRRRPSRTRSRWRRRTR